MGVLLLGKESAACALGEVVTGGNMGFNPSGAVDGVGLLNGSTISVVGNLGGMVIEPDSCPGALLKHC